MFGLAKSSAVLFLVKSLLLGTRIVALLAIAKFGTANELASASYAVALAEMFRWFADWGTDTWSIRAIAFARDSASRAQLVTSALCVKLVGGCLFGLTVLLVCLTRFPTAGVYLGFAAVALLIAGQIAGLSISYFQTLNRIRQILFLAPPCVMTMIATVVVVVITRNGGMTLATLGIGELLMAAILLRALYRRGALRIRYVSVVHIKNVIRESTPAAALNLIVGLYSRIDTMALAQISTTALATYTVANRLFLPFQVGVTTLGAIIYSMTATAVAGHRETSRKFYSGELPATALISAGAGVALWVGGEAAIRGYLPGFSAAIPVLKILCILLVILGCNAAIAARAIAHGRMSATATVAAIDLACTGVAMLVLTPAQGAVGAAKALLLGACVNLSLILCYVWFIIERREPSAVAR